MSVILTPKTVRGKNKIHEAGNPRNWIILKQSESVSFSEKEGPWYYIRPDNNSSDKERWVNLHNDNDFIVNLI